MDRNLPNDVLTPGDAAKYLNTTPGYLANLRWLGAGPRWVRLPFHRGRIFYRRDDLDAYMNGIYR